MARRLGGVAIAALIAGAAGQAGAVQCALYARDVTGVALSGDAYSWWGQAAGLYERGHAPTSGAILVFERSYPMRHGHVAVVRRVVGAREVMIDHANWGSYGGIEKNVSVIDVSPRNDWTQVQVAWGRNGTHGRTNATFGFIYPRGQGAAPRLIPAVATYGSAMAAPLQRISFAPPVPGHKPAKAIKVSAPPRPGLKPINPALAPAHQLPQTIELPQLVPAAYTVTLPVRPTLFFD